MPCLPLRQVAFNLPSDTKDSASPFAIIRLNAKIFQDLPTKSYILAMADEALKNRKHSSTKVLHYQNLAQQFLDRNNTEKALRNSWLSLQHFQWSPETVRQNLCLKATILIEMEHWQDALRTLEVAEMASTEKNYLMHTLMLRCYEHMKLSSKAHKLLKKCAHFCNTFRDVVQCYRKRESPSWQVDNDLENKMETFDEYEQLIERGTKLPPSTIDVDLNIRGEMPSLTPTLAFKFLPNDNIRILADTDIVASQLIYAEKPLITHLEVSSVQCYQCHLPTMYTVSCVMCQQVFYCSKACMVNDQAYHDYECEGYQILFFPLVDGTMELRMLMDVLTILQNNASDRSARKAEDLFRIARQSNNYQYSVVFMDSWDYKALRSDDFQQVMKKSQNILEYLNYSRLPVEKLTSIWPDLEPNEYEVFLGGVLLHLATMNLRKGFNISYSLPQDATFTLPREGAEANDPKCWTRTNVDQYFADTLASATDEQETITALRLYCAGYRNKFCLLPVANKDGLVPNRVRSIYPNSMQLQHSCDPNVMPNFVGRAQLTLISARDIKAGEEIKICYGAHYKSQVSAVQRRQFLAARYINCTCSFCGIKQQRKSQEALRKYEQKLHSLDTTSGLPAYSTLLIEVFTLAEESFVPLSIELVQQYAIIAKKAIAFISKLNAEFLRSCMNLVAVYCLMIIQKTREKALQGMNILVQKMEYDQELFGELQILTVKLDRLSAINLLTIAQAVAQDVGLASV